MPSKHVDYLAKIANEGVVENIENVSRQMNLMCVDISDGIQLKAMNINCIYEDQVSVMDQVELESRYIYSYASCASQPNNMQQDSHMLYQGCTAESKNAIAVYWSQTLKLMSLLYCARYNNKQDPSSMHAVLAADYLCFKQIYTEIEPMLQSIEIFKKETDVFNVIEGNLIDVQTKCDEGVINSMSPDYFIADFYNTIVASRIR